MINSYIQLVEEQLGQVRKLQQEYEELIYAVVKKFPGETRHQTALRYIKEREQTANESLLAKENKP